MASFRFTLTLLIAILVACTQIDTPSPIPETLIYNPTTAATSTATTLPPTETPTPTEARRELVICTGSEPDSLYLYGTSMYISNIVQEAVYDGPNSFFASSDTWNIEEYDFGEGCE